MKRSIKSLWCRFAADEGGVVSILAVAAIVAAIGVSVIVIDAGSLLYAKRQLQAATDAAAMAAVRDLNKAGGDPVARAQEVFDANNVVTTKDPEVISGGYNADESKSAEDRFDEGASTPNAVKVIARIDSPTYFAQFFGADGSSEVYAESTAAMVNQASISAGTGLASIDPTIANNLLTALLGTSVNLSAVQYTGLVDTKISALAFMDALATRVGITGTYGDLLTANASVGDILGATLDVLTSGDTSQSSGDPVAAQQALLALHTTALDALDLSVGAVIDASELADRSIGNIVATGDNNLDVNVYDLVAASIMGQATGETIDLALTPTVAGLTALDARVAIGSPAAYSKLGPPGTFVKTAQIRIALDASLGTSNIPVLGQALNLDVPLYVEAASGTATISAIPCNRNGTMVDVAGESGVTKAMLGNVDDATFSDFTNHDSLIGVLDDKPVLANVANLVKVSASASGEVGKGGPETKSYAYSELYPDGPDGDLQSVTKQVSAGVGSANLAADLIGSLDVETNLLGNTLLNALLHGIVSSATTAVGTAVKTAIIPLLNVVDAITDSLLATLGVKIGTLDMSVNGVSCGVPKLVG